MQQCHVHAVHAIDHDSYQPNLAQQLLCLIVTYLPAIVLFISVTVLLMLLTRLCDISIFAACSSQQEH